MSIIGVVSMKGGVGKTSVTANLAAAMAGKLNVGRVHCVDLDPQNGLHWHFGLANNDSSGVCEQSLHSSDWREIATPGNANVFCLPYGDVNESDREKFEALLAQQPHWIGSQLQRASLSPSGVVLIDTPPGPSVYLKQVFECADLILVILLPDAGSYATIPAMETWLDEADTGPKGRKMFYVLNQVDRSEPLNRDTAAFLLQQLGARMCPIEVHNDEAVGEALAFQQPVLEYAPYGQASIDLAHLATWAINTLSK